MQVAASAPEEYTRPKVSRSSSAMQPAGGGCEGHPGGCSGGGGPLLAISRGRHPVLERLLPPDVRQYQPNDTYITPTESLHLVTGPNMSGKTTYMKQVRSGAERLRLIAAVQA